MESWATVGNIAAVSRKRCTPEVCYEANQDEMEIRRGESFTEERSLVVNTA